MDFIGILGLLFFILLGVGFPSYVVYDLYQTRRKAPWREFAATNGLTYKYSKFFGRGDSITGIYRGYGLKLETVRRHVFSEEARTHIILSAHNPTDSRLSGRKKELAIESLTITDGLQPFTTAHKMEGQIKGGEDPEIIQYIRDDIVTDMAYLRSVFDLLANVVDAYYKVHKIDLAWPKTCKYYGCRICYSTQDYFEGNKVIAVLDREMDKNPSRQDGVLWINWLAERTLFDFDEVNIIQATDEEVERFAVQVGNDTDPFRKPRYKEMLCLIEAGCDLSENTIRILQRMFGQVATKR